MGDFAEVADGRWHARRAAAERAWGIVPPWFVECGGEVSADSVDGERREDLRAPRHLLFPMGEGR